MAALRHRLLLASALTLALLCAAAGPTAAAAQDVYGGIRGAVTDSLGPVAGVRVSLVGTGYVAITDQDGRYAMEGVPAGDYTARVEAGRRSPVEQSGVRVSAGAAVIVDVRFGGGGIVVRAAGDELGSRTLLDGGLLARLPIDDVRQGLALASGVVLRGTDRGIADVPFLKVRGSTEDQTAVLVDGAPARFSTLGVGQLALAAGTISEVSVVTGTPPASEADARGGTIAYLTRAGGPRFEAGFSAGTDGPFSRSATVGYNRYDGFAGGPMPGVRNLTWFVSGALYGQSSGYRGAGADTMPTFGLAGVDTVASYADASGTSYTTAVPRFAQVSGTCGLLGSGDSAQPRALRANYGLACQGLRLNLDWSTSRRAQAKLLYTYGQGSSASLTGLASDLQQRDYPGADIADNLLFTGTRRHSALAVLNWRHRLTEPLHGALTLSGNVSVGTDGYQAGPLALVSELATRDPAGGIEFSMLRFAGLEGLSLPLTDAVIQRVRSNTFRPPYYGRNDLAPRQAFRFNPYGVATGWPTSGFGGEVTVASETRVDGRLRAEWRATAAATVTVGGDFSRTDLSYYAAALISGFGSNAFLTHPRRSGLFGALRLDVGGAVLEAGLRSDRYATGADFPSAPGRIFSNPASAAGDTSYAARMSRVLDPGRVQTLVTPRLRMGFQVDAATTGRVGFSQQVEVPPFAALFSNVNSDLATTDQSVDFGRDVSYVRSTLIEGGVRHEFGPGLALDVSAYTKTNAMPYAFRSVNVYDPFIGGTPGLMNESLNLLTTTSGERVSGADARLEWNGGHAVSGTLAYSLSHLQFATTTQSVAASVTLRAPDAWVSRSVLGPVLRGVRADLAARLTSGDPYTVMLNQGTGAIVPGPVSATLPPLFDSRLPWTTLVDLRVGKAITVAGVRYRMYAEVRNLLNWTGLVAAFAETGTDRNQLFRSYLFVPQISSLASDAGALWFTRQVTVNGVQQQLQGVDLSDCSQYRQGLGGSRGPADCLALRQVEARWGNGDRFYDTNEINRALNAWYETSYGTWRFHGPARTARVGIEVAF